MWTHIWADMKLSKLLSQCCVKAFPSNPKYRKKWVIVWTHTPKGLWNTRTRVSAKNVQNVGRWKIYLAYHGDPLSQIKIVKPEYAQLVLMHIESRVRHLAKCQQRKPVYVECLDISSAPNRCVCHSEVFRRSGVSCGRSQQPWTWNGWIVSRYFNNYSSISISSFPQVPSRHTTRHARWSTLEQSPSSSPRWGTKIFPQRSSRW